MRRSELPRRLMYAALAAATLLAFSCSTSPAQKNDPSLTDLVVKGDLTSINKLLADKEKLKKEANSPDGQGLYPLHHAVMQGNSQIAEILIVFGSELDHRDPTGKTPLRYAIDRKQAEMAQMLVARGADPFAADVSNSTPAEAALSAGTEMIKAVFNVKNINAAGKDGRTALHIACDKRMVDEVSTLLDIGASITILDKANRTPLDLALLYSEDKSAAVIAEKIIQKDKSNAKTNFPDFRWFVDMVNSPDYSTFRNSGTDRNSALHEAVSRQQTGFVDFLLSKKLSAGVPVFGPNAVDAKNNLGEAPLHIAVRKGYVAGARLLLDHQADPNILDGNGNTPLHLVTSSSGLVMTKLLLEKKAKPAIADSNGDTPLHKAVKLTLDDSIVKELIKADAPVNAVNKEGDTPLMICVKAGTYQYAESLIAAGSDVFRLNNKGDTPLSIAIRRGVDAVDKIILPSNVLNQEASSGNSVLAYAISQKAVPEIVLRLLKKGADPRTTNTSRDTALHIAVRNNLIDQSLILIDAKASIFAENSAQDTPVSLALMASGGPYDWFFTPEVIAARDDQDNTIGHLAAKKNLADGLDYLFRKNADLTAVNKSNETLLHTAVRADAKEAAYYLIDKGAVLSARNRDGDAALNVAVLSGSKACFKALVLLPGIDLNARNYSGETALHQAIRKQNTEFATYLIDRSAALEYRDNTGLTPLAVAAREVQTGIAQYLIKAGSAIDARDYTGSTPLYYAVSVEKGQPDLVRMLIQSGADILAKNALGDSPLLASLKKGQSLVREILGSPAIDKADSEGKTPLRILVEARASLDTLRLVLAENVDPSSRDRFADTPLHAALMQKDYAAANLLLSAKADPFAPNQQRITPLAIVLKDTAALKDFTQAAGLATADALGETFLHYAVRAGSAEAVKTLLDLGVDRNARNISGESAMDIAQAKGNQAVSVLFN
ncbi:MAG: ankyrin repeat domain-containing protein [Spirochaetes bacterium]|nr:ankyrin repeat domain-containing protein [Spirochaetota bacterium]